MTVARLIDLILPVGGDIFHARRAFLRSYYTLSVFGFLVLFVCLRC